MREPVRYFAPGPVWVDAEVRRALTGPVVPHRSSEFQGLWASIGERLQTVFRTKQDVMTTTSSATFALEAALVSLSPSKVLCLTNGAFSERWLAIARSRGLNAEALAVEWGRAVEPDDLKKALDAARPDVVTLAHCETSTGALNPLRELSAAIHQHSDALVLVDVVSSLAGAPVETDGWGLDVVVTASQKALGLPPGLAFFSVSDRAWDRVGAVERRGFYTDFLRYRDKHAGRGPITTPAIPLIYALDAQLDRVLAEGLEARWTRHRGLLRHTEDWVSRSRFQYASTPEVRSPTVSCLRTPSGESASQLVEKLSQDGFVVGSGYGRLGEKTFRIGHMAEVERSDLDSLFAAIDSLVV